MNRFTALVALLLVGAPAYAGNGISFSVGGHRIHIDSLRCRSSSCVSVSDSSRRDDDDSSRSVRTTAPVPAATASTPVALVPPPAAALPPAPVYQPVAVAPQLVAAPPAPPPPVPTRVLAAPPPPPDVTPVEPARPAPPVAPPVSRVTQEIDETPAEGPIGDWQSGPKGFVRIAACGRALCGYRLDADANTTGEAVLINMKLKSDAQWSGGVYSHDSGDTYYGTMEIKGTERLRVEACALGRFYCTGTDWTRVARRPQRVMTGRQLSAEPRS